MRKCRQTGAITELGAFPSADRPPVQGPTEPTEPVELSLFASLDADFAAARKAAAIDGALDEARVDARLPALLQAGLSAWIDENNLSGTFSVDGLPCRNPPLHARLRQVINLDLEEEIHWSLRAVVNTHHTAALTRLRSAMTASGLGLSHGKRNLIILRNQKWSTGPATQKVLTELGRLGGTTFRLDTDDLAVFNALSESAPAARRFHHTLAAGASTGEQHRPSQSHPSRHWW